MISERLRVVKKLVRRAGYGRTKEGYCIFTAKNDKRKHKLKTIEGTKLFELLENNVVSENPKFGKAIYVDGVYRKNKLIMIKNCRVYD